MDETFAGEEVPETLEADLSAGGLKADYFNNTDFRDLVLSRVDPVINFVFDGAPEPGIVNENFSARWTGLIQPKFTERYTFTTRSDGRVRLFVNDQRVIDSNGNGRVVERSGQLNLVAGMPVAIRLEYVDFNGDATMKLFWQSASQSRQIVPSSALFPDPTLPVPFAAQDVGQRRNSEATFDEESQTFTLRTRTRGLGGQRDNVFFIAQPLQDESDVSARVMDMSEASDSTRTGIMIRANMDENAAFAALLIDRDGRIVFQHREVANGQLRTDTGPRVQLPYFLKLSREVELEGGLEVERDRVRALISADGVTWRTISREDVTFGRAALYGLTSASRDGSTAESVIDRVTAVRPYLFLMRDGIGAEQAGSEYYGLIGAEQGMTLNDFERRFMRNQRRVRAYYRNAVDLGFWREMECTERIVRGNGACWVRNWEDEEDRFNGSADLGTVAMNITEEGYIRFYIFGPVEGVLTQKAILDSEGVKVAPALCTVCHGGAVTPGNPDLGSVFREFEPSMLARRSGISQAQAEREWFALNNIVREANKQLRSEAEGAPLGMDRNKAAMELHMSKIYLSTNPIRSRPITDEIHVPDSWKQAPNPTMQAAQTEVFTRLVSHYCQGCHRISPVDFSNYAVWSGLGAKVNGEYFINRVLFDRSDDPRRLEQPVMPQAQLMVNDLRRDSRALSSLDGWLIQAANPNAPQSKVTFSVTNLNNVGQNQEVRVFGPSQAMGADNAANGVLLTRAGNGRFTGFAPLTQGETVEFKIAVVENGQVVRAETGAPHSFAVPMALTATANATFQQ